MTPLLALATCAAYAWAFAAGQHYLTARRYRLRTRRPAALYYLACLTTATLAVTTLMTGR